MKYARRRISSSAGSPDVGVGSTGRDAEICVSPPGVFLVAADFRGALAAVARRRLARFPVVFFAAGMPGSVDG